MYLDNPLYEDHPPIDGWLKWIIGLVTGGILVTALILLYFDRLGALVLFAAAIFDALVFYCTIPRSYQIYSDRLKIVLGRPFSMTVPFKDIRAVRRVEGGLAWASSGIRFSTSSRYIVEISRRGKFAVTISPGGGDVFIQQIEQALKTYIRLR